MKKIEWTRARWGEQTDSQIARELGCSLRGVQSYRRTHKIQPSQKRGAAKALADADLAGKPLKKIAEELGVHRVTIGRELARRGLETPRARGRIRWENVDWTKSDDDIATELAVKVNAVKQRRRLKAKADARAPNQAAVEAALGLPKGERAKALRALGLTWTAIAKLVGVTSKQGAARQAKHEPASKARMELVERLMQETDDITDQRERARTMKAGGARTVEIARALGVAACTVVRWCRADTEPGVVRITVRGSELAP